MCGEVLPLQNKFPVNWEFLGIPNNSKTCKLEQMLQLGIFWNIWEWLLCEWELMGISRKNWELLRISENGQAEVFWARKQDLEFLGIFENQDLIVNGREEVTKT